MRCIASITFLVLIIVWNTPTSVSAQTGIINTKHNLSVSGPGPIQALSETRICIFCHTPHNAAPGTPLWNKAINPINYNTYESSTLIATIPQPTGPSRLCLSCHDGTIALGTMLGAGVIAMNQELTGRASLLGTDISDDHPVSFSYQDSLPNNELHSSLPPDLLAYAGDVIHCSTCHDPHDDTFGMFLAVDNRYSNLCTKCHSIGNWTTSTHSLSAATWNSALPNPWPVNERLSPAHQRHTVAENGCENCHTPHNSGSGMRLLAYQREEENCYPCHNGNVSSKNIQIQISKISNHPVAATTLGLTANAHDPAEDPASLSEHVECFDCHNSHVVDNATASAPMVSGSLAQVSGVNKLGNAVNSASYEYEICLKCHGDTNVSLPVIDRIINEVNTRLEFDPINPSYHPVMDVGNNPSDVPSIPSSYYPSMTALSIIYCTDCHDSNDSPEVGNTGPKGPHGSLYSPILRQRYDKAIGTPESAGTYALCYRCHDRTSILNDESFQKRIVTGGGGHAAHLTGHGQGLTKAASCATCHDPHGINDDGVSGDHTHLINFESLNVFPAGTNSAPLFVDLGSRSGYCLLVCHGVTHDATNHSYP